MSFSRFVLVDHGEHGAAQGLRTAERLVACGGANGAGDQIHRGGRGVSLAGLRILSVHKTNAPFIHRPVVLPQSVETNGRAHGYESAGRQAHHA